MPAREAEVAAAMSLAASQGATVFELRAALDDFFELRGELARVALVDVLGRVPDSALPEVARARQLLE